MFGMNENHCKAAVFRNALKVIKHSGESYLIKAQFCLQKISPIFGIHINITLCFKIDIIFNYDTRN
jgi:hypothetical protein